MFYRETGSEPTVQIMGGKYDGAQGVLVEDPDVEQGFFLVELADGNVIKVAERGYAPLHRETGS